MESTPAPAVTWTFLGLGLMMFIFVALQLTARKKSGVSYPLSLFFGCLGYVWLYFGLYRATRLAWAPGLLYSDVFVTFLLGPLLHSYVSRLSGAPRRRPARRLLHYLPALAVLLYLILLNPGADPAAAAAPGPNPDYHAVPVIGMLNQLGDASFFCYVLVSTDIVARLLRTGDRPFRRAFRGVLIYFINALLTFILFFTGHLLRRDDLLSLAVLINGINSAWFFFLSYRYPEYTQRAVRAAAGAATKTPPPSAGVAEILAGLHRAMEEDREYRDPDLTLQDLSARLGVQHHQLSRILNRYLGTSFRGYINRCRLMEARRLLVDEPEMSILQIAYAVGFNSKSAFNSVFAREIRLSPSEYRKKFLTARPAIANLDDGS